MTETRSPKRTIAEIVREAETPRSEYFKLSGEAARLGREIQIADKWVEAAAHVDMNSDLWERAEKIRDDLEMELAYTVWEMEVSAARRREEVYNEERPAELKVEDPEASARLGTLSEVLVEAYTILASVPQELLGLGGDESSPRTRYKLMGALLEAKDKADAEMARLEHGAQARE